jgi:hypothetical protein
VVSDVTVILRLDENDATVLRQVNECRVVCVNEDGSEGADLPAHVLRVGTLPDPADYESSAGG